MTWDISHTVFTVWNEVKESSESCLVTERQSEIKRFEQLNKNNCFVRRQNAEHHTIDHCKEGKICDTETLPEVGYQWAPGKLTYKLNRPLWVCRTFLKAITKVCVAVSYRKHIWMLTLYMSLSIMCTYKSKASHVLARRLRDNPCVSTL